MEKQWVMMRITIMIYLLNRLDLFNSTSYKVLMFSKALTSFELLFQWISEDYCGFLEPCNKFQSLEMTHYLDWRT